MRRFALLCVPLLAATAGCHRQAAPAPQARDPVGAEAQGVPAGTVDTAQKGKAPPTTPVLDDADAPAKLSDLKGKPLLVNLWATWCVPCVKELPTLDALAQNQAGKLTVVAVSEDMEGRRVVAPFMAKHGFKTLKPWLDTSNALLLQLKESALPVTILYGADGKELWRVHGDLDWTGARAKALLAQAGV